MQTNQREQELVEEIMNLLRDELGLGYADASRVLSLAKERLEQFFANKFMNFPVAEL